MGKAYDHLAEKVNFTRALNKVPAVMVALVRNHGGFAMADVWGVRKYGFADNDPKGKATGGDAFMVGSVSKPISGYLMACLLKATEFTWETTIGEVFPELKSEACRRHFNIRDDYLRASIRDMMTHTARFSWTPTFGTHMMLNELIGDFDERQRAEYCTREALMRRRFNYVIASQRDAPAPVGTYNGGPILPVAMMERGTGKSFEQLIKQYVFDPLDMKGAGVGRASTRADPPDGVWLHYYDFQKREPVPNAEFGKRVVDFNSHAPAGTIHLTALDAIKFISTHCDGYTGPRPLKGTWLQETFRPFANGCSVSGWITGGTGARRFVTHDGSAGNEYTRIKIWPDLGEGYSVSTNVGGKGPLNNQPDFDFGLHVVNNIAFVVEDMLTNWRTKFPGG